MIKEVKDFIKQFKSPLCRHHFNDDDAIRVLDNQGHFTREAKFQETSKSQTFVTFMLFLEAFGFSRYDARADMTSPEGDITCWLKIVQK